MKRNKEIILLVLTLTSLVTLLATRDVAMSDSVLYMIVGLFSVGVMGFGALTWLERPADEREKELNMVASKHAYVASSLVIALGIVVQSLEHTLDIWLPLALAASLGIKLVSHLIHRRQQE